MRFITVLIGCALLFCLGRPAAAQPCESEQRGCFTFEMLAVTMDPANAMLVDVASGRRQPYEDEIAKHVLLDAKASRVQFYPGLADILVYVWGSSGQGLDRVQIYDNPDGGWRKARPGIPMPANLNSVPSLGQPDFVFNVKTIGMVAMITFPDEFFTPETQVMLCAPTLPTIWPDRARQQGIWYTSGTLSWYRQHGTWRSSFFLMPAEEASSGSPAQVARSTFRY